jgi:hypothetical protein
VAAAGGSVATKEATGEVGPLTLLRRKKQREAAFQRMATTVRDRRLSRQTGFPLAEPPDSSRHTSAVHPAISFEAICAASVFSARR